MTKEKTNMADYFVDMMVVLIIAFFSVAGVVSVFNIQTGKIISVEKYNRALNTIAELKCPLMQYENDKICLEYENKCYYEIITPQLIGRIIINAINMIPCESVIEGYSGIKINRTECIEYNISYQNFTTGRYIDGKIECCSEEFHVLHIITTDETYIDCYGDSQNFTLEEFEIR